MNLFKRKAVILIVMWWLALLLPLVLLCFGFILLAIYASVFSAFMRMTLPYRTTKLPGYEFFLLIVGSSLFLIYLFMIGAAHKILMAIHSREYPILLCGGAITFFIVVVLRDCRRFSAVSKDEIKSYYKTG
jgi:hypothetical protein